MRSPSLLLALTLLLALGLSACGAGGGSEAVGEYFDPPPSVLHQATYLSGTGRYAVGANGAYPELGIELVGDDLDTDRWAMFYDGSHYRLAFFTKDAPPRVVLFGYNAATGTYQRGYPSAASIPLKGLNADMDLSSFAMLRGESTWRLYLKSREDPKSLYQFGYDGSALRFGYDSIPVVTLTGLPGDADLSRWAMHYGGGTYRVMVGRHGTTTSYYQLGYRPGTPRYEYGYASTDVVTVEGMPSGAITTRFASLYADGLYRLYHLGR
jgi:hypothetical protein